jgi:CelD/BcsL family acetyltransferase involved in cellulose biosynthesis
MTLGFSPLPRFTVLSPEDQQWRMFAAGHAGSPMQHPTWLDALVRAYRLEARIMALTDGSILAALPVVRSRLPRRPRWTSLPFTDTLEPVSVNSGYRDELVAAVAEQRDIQPVLIRTGAGLPGWSCRQVGTTQVIDLSNGADHVLRSASLHHRRSVDRARRRDTGLSARLITCRREFLVANLALYTQSRRRLGAPTQPRRYWSQLWRMHERDQAVTIGVYLDDALVASGVFMVGSGRAVLKHAASDLATRRLRTNHMMFITAFEQLAARGERFIDFGITDLHNSGLRNFKARWGGEERPAYFSATDARLLPDTLEPGRLVSQTIKHTPAVVGRTVGTLGYRFVA